MEMVGFEGHVHSRGTSVYEGGSSSTSPAHNVSSSPGSARCCFSVYVVWIW